MDETRNGLFSPPVEDVLHRVLLGQAGMNEEALAAAADPAHPDDERFFDYWEGRLSPEDRATVEKHAALCPVCFPLFAGIGELVVQSPASAQLPEPARSAGSTGRKTVPPSPKRPPRRVPLSLALVAAVVLLGIGLAVGLWGEPLLAPPAPVSPTFSTRLARLTPVEGKALGGNPAPLIRNTGSIYEVPAACWLDLGSSRSGVANIAVLTDRGREIYSEQRSLDHEENPIAIVAGKPTVYGPIHAPDRPAIVFLIVTQTPCTQILQRVFPSTGTTPDKLDSLLDRLEDELKMAGHTWMDVQRIAMEKRPN